MAKIADDLGIFESCLPNWMKQCDVDEGRQGDGLTTAEREELTRLRRELKVAKLESEVLKTGGAHFVALVGRLERSTSLPMCPALFLP